MDENFDGFGETVASMSEAGKEMLLQLMTATVGTIGPAFGGLKKQEQCKREELLQKKWNLHLKVFQKGVLVMILK